MWLFQNLLGQKASFSGTFWAVFIFISGISVYPAQRLEILLGKLLLFLAPKNTLVGEGGWVGGDQNGLLFFIYKYIDNEEALIPNMVSIGVYG